MNKKIKQHIFIFLGDAMTGKTILARLCDRKETLIRDNIYDAKNQDLSLDLHFATSKNKKYIILITNNRESFDYLRKKISGNW